RIHGERYWLQQWPVVTNRELIHHQRILRTRIGVWKVEVGLNITRRWIHQFHVRQLLLPGFSLFGPSPGLKLRNKLLGLFNLDLLLFVFLTLNFFTFSPLPHGLFE